MPECRVTLSTNAGVSLEFKTKKVWVDAVSDSNPMDFSFLTPEMWERMKADDRFKAPDAICFTHCHGDHFSEKYTREAKALWPEAMVMLPEVQFEDWITIDENKVISVDRSLNIEFCRLPHEGTLFSDSIHYGILLEYYGYTVLFPGDCIVACDALKAWIGKRRINAVFLDFPWITCEAGRNFIKDVIKPEYAVIYHFPRREKDRFGYLKAATRGCQFLDKSIKSIILNEDFTSEYLRW